MTDDQAERLIVLLESIAQSLARLANPPLVMDNEGRIAPVWRLSDHLKPAADGR